MIDIFTQGKEMTIQSFYFKEVGDKVQGTYIGKRTGEVDQFGNDIVVYELSTEDGIRNVPLPVSKRRFHEDMNFVKFGQIVGFTFTGMSASYISKVTGKPTSSKDIKIFADPKIVNTTWVAMHLDGSNDSGAGKESGNVDIKEAQSKSDAAFAAFTAPADEPFPSANSTPAQKLKAISDLAKEKLGVIDPAAVKDAVMEFSGLAFLPVNYDAIIKSLEAKF